MLVRDEATYPPQFQVADYTGAPVVLLGTSADCSTLSLSPRGLYAMACGLYSGGVQVGPGLAASWIDESSLLSKDYVSNGPVVNGPVVVATDLQGNTLWSTPNPAAREVTVVDADSYFTLDGILSTADGHPLWSVPAGMIVQAVAGDYAIVADAPPAPGAPSAPGRDRITFERWR